MPKLMSLYRPSPALVLAFLALLVALGGVGYAAQKLPKDSVGAKQIKADAVRGAEVQDGSLTGAEVQDGSLTGGDFAAGQLPASTFVMRQGPDAVLPATGYGKAEVSCNAGERATGGGVYNEANVTSILVTSSYPTPNPTTAPPTGNGQVPTGWRVWLRNEVASPRTVNAYVICASP